MDTIMITSTKQVQAKNKNIANIIIDDNLDDDLNLLYVCVCNKKEIKKWAK